MTLNIKDFLKSSQYKYYNIAIYYAAIKNILDRKIFIKALGGVEAHAFRELKKLREFSDYCVKNGAEGFPTPIYDNDKIARGHEQLAVLLSLDITTNDFLFIEKQYEPKNFNETWLKSFLNKKESSEVIAIYESLLSK